jgi:hypothetical protein
MTGKYAAMATAFLLWGCGEDWVSAEPSFQHGDMVQTVIGGKEGMVVGIYCPKDRGAHPPLCLYDVRVLALDVKTNTSWLGDGSVDWSPFALVTFREFEIRKATGHQP